MQFNEKLKSLRSEKGISQTELAKQIFVSRSAVAKWENGLGLPNEDSLNQLAVYFDVPISYLQSDPVHEDVVIQKNTTLSKQKIIIITLAVLLSVIAVIAAVIIPLSLKNNDGYVTPPPKQIPGRGLIFTSTERYPIHTLSQYKDEELSPNNYFPTTRIFTLPNDTSQIKIYPPDLEVASYENGEIVYGEIDYDKLKFFFTQGLYAALDRNDRQIRISLLDPSVTEYVGCVNIKYGEEIMSLKIVKKPTPVESVRLRFGSDDNNIGLGRNANINVNIYPLNATYQDYTLAIDRIERPDGSFYLEDLSKYASIKFVNGVPMLYTEKTLEINSKIHITATTTKDNVKSDTLTVSVNRVPIESISFNAIDLSHSIQAGESKGMYLNIYPYDATANLLNEEFTVKLLTDDIAKLERSDNCWVLTASDKFQNIGQTIRVQVIDKEGFFWIFEWTISAVPIENMLIINTQTNAELDETVHLNRGDTWQLDALVLPENASFSEINYNLFSDLPNFGAYVSITTDGLLTVSNSAPINMEIFLSITFGRYHSKPYNIVVK